MSKNKLFLDLHGEILKIYQLDSISLKIFHSLFENNDPYDFFQTKCLVGLKYNQIEDRLLKMTEDIYKLIHTKTLVFVKKCRVYITYKNLPKITNYFVSIEYIINDNDKNENEDPMFHVCDDKHDQTFFKPISEIGIFIDILKTINDKQNYYVTNNSLSNNIYHKIFDKSSFEKYFKK